MQRNTFLCTSKIPKWVFHKIRKISFLRNLFYVLSLFKKEKTPQSHQEEILQNLFLVVIYHPYISYSVLLFVLLSLGLKMSAVFPLEDALTRRQYMERIELRLSRQKAFPFPAKMLAPLPFLGVVGEVLLGSDLWASGGFHDPTVLMKEAGEAFSRTGGRVGG